ncbi:Regulator of G-protein signaling 12 [Halotydeus destructor]|nr:Regulator of G-protein signaling 12 [Halotydeus destructor]
MLDSSHNGTEVASNHTECRGNRTTSWAMSFDNLLGDAAGIYAFTTFCRTELNDENIRFYRACVNFSKCNEAELSSLAEAIFYQFLSKDATEPVNVDNKARRAASDALDNPSAIMFHEAQTQIYNLMKYDIYKRFLGSTEFSSCIALERQNKSLPSADPVRPRTSNIFNWYRSKSFRPRISLSSTAKKKKKNKTENKNSDAASHGCATPVSKKSDPSQTPGSALKYISQSEFDLSYKLRETEHNSEDFFNDIIRGAQCAPTSKSDQQDPLFSFLSQPCLYNMSEKQAANIRPTQFKTPCLREKKISPSSTISHVTSRRFSLARFAVSPTRCKSMVLTLDDDYQMLWDTGATPRKESSASDLRSKIPIRKSEIPPPVPPKFKLPFPPPPPRSQSRTSKIPRPESMRTRSPPPIIV